MNRYYIDPFGCVKNQVDAENMMARLNNAGWESTADAESSDLIIINSCGFIESAKQESINAVLGWRTLYPKKKILLAGCLAQRYAKELPGILTEADGFFGVDNLNSIVEKTAEIFSGDSSKGHFDSANKTSCDKAQTIRHSTGERPLLSLPGSAYVKISEGCDNHCSYCTIPLIRGGLVSREIPGIVDECRTLLTRGVKELCIIGQDIGAFGTDRQKKIIKNAAAGERYSQLPELLNAVSMLDGNFWVRLLYIHPDHFPLEILDLMAKDKRFLPYFDIPFQHASEKILNAMNRRGTAAQYLELLKIIRARLPDAVIRSTFLLGFPGETKEDFAALLDFQEKARLDWLGCFTYSREEGTKSYSMKGRVPAKTAVMRKNLIEERQIPITEKNMERFSGRDMDALLEEKFDVNSTDTGESDEIFWLGRTYCQAPDIDGSTVIVLRKQMADNGKNPQAGTFLNCRIIARRGFDLEARIAI